MGCTTSGIKVVNQPDFTGACITEPAKAAAHAKGTDTTGRGRFHRQHIIVRRLGKGAFSRVYATVRKSDGEVFAAKIIDLRSKSTLEDKVRPDSRMVHLAEKEAEMLERLGKQDHCIRMIESFTEGHFKYIVTEVCNGTLLQALARARSLNECFYASIFRQMFMALNAIHKLQVVHLDVKPDNFLCDSCANGDMVKLCDFGLATIVRPGTLGLRDVYGIAPFMAPEMLQGEWYNTPVDVWSVAVIAYALFFGEFPYQPDDRSAKAMKAAILLGVEPSFQPGSSLKVNGSLSEVASHFVQDILCRDQMLRPSADKVLKHPYLNPRSTEILTSGELCDLRPMLNSAKKMGAFTGAWRKDKNEKDGSGDTVEDHLAALQAHYHASMHIFHKNALEDRKPVQSVGNSSLRQKERAPESTNSHELMKCSETRSSLAASTRKSSLASFLFSPPL